MKEVGSREAKRTNVYRVGESVLIRKYGKRYHGKVVAIGRVTVTVEFKTIAGVTKRIKVSGSDVRYDLEKI